MNRVNLLASSGIILLIAGLTVLLSAFVLLVLSQLGMIAFTGGGWIVHTFSLITGYLGYSILFFLPVLAGYCFFFARLRRSLFLQMDSDQTENIRFYNGGMEMTVTLFFAIGVLFTAWGMQNALVSALGDVSKTEAARMGAWGILKRMVDNGILIALWTTIVGGAGGYLMRLVKYTFLGRALNRFSIHGQDVEKGSFFEAIESIRLKVDRIEQHISSKG